MLTRYPSDGQCKANGGGGTRLPVVGRDCIEGLELEVGKLFFLRRGVRASEFLVKVR